ncbi:helix-turn-helix domain-containing protein [Pseudomonas fuscovaginae UPB0736]|uniref:Putative transcriptional regulator n=1 Tax=Pseudomonas asplenii TaxID=53407 RepID=A0A1H6MVH5_9PSED|nr:MULTISPECIES: helix-turn-helix domain-containing protein [Pseudomonas]UUQ63000.1 helix-turn-helix domain-containing protein [Pseudomonas fuscovaginae UPB0736]UZE28494.1 helix-turn-helix domain-containing protein [Pseudomonas asplenii]SEI01664.1 putative transcriptional regulator [Pseudomonas fuscovaginae]
MNNELEQFQKDLLTSVRQMKAGKAARITNVTLTAAAEARTKVGLSQNDFAQLLGVSLRTLQDWEQGRRQPTGAARTLLLVASQHPEVLRDLQSV